MTEDPKSDEVKSDEFNELHAQPKPLNDILFFCYDGTPIRTGDVYWFVDVGHAHRVKLYYERVMPGFHGAKGWLQFSSEEDARAYHTKFKKVFDKVGIWEPVDQSLPPQRPKFRGQEVWQTYPVPVRISNDVPLWELYGALVYDYSTSSWVGCMANCRVTHWLRHIQEEDNLVIMTKNEFWNAMMQVKHGGKPPELQTTPDADRTVQDQ